MFETKLIIYEEAEITFPKEIIELLDEGNQVVIENDPAICMVNGGSTYFWKDGDVYKEFSEGPNWSDMQEEERDIEYLTSRFKTALEEIESAFIEYGHDTEDAIIPFLKIGVNIPDGGEYDDDTI